MIQAQKSASMRLSRLVSHHKTKYVISKIAIIPPHLFSESWSCIAAMFASLYQFLHAVWARSRWVRSILLLGDLNQQHRWLPRRNCWHSLHNHPTLLVQFHDSSGLSHVWLLTLCCCDSWMDAHHWSIADRDFLWAPSIAHFCLLCCDLWILYLTESGVQEVLSDKGPIVCFVHCFYESGVPHWSRYVLLQALI